MKQPAKTILIVVAILMAIPLTCCGLPFGFLYAIAPTTYVCELEGCEGYWGYPAQKHPDYTIENINFHAFLRGKEDYAGDHKGPRSFRSNATRFDSRTREMPDDIEITILDFEVVINGVSVISRMSNDSLPYVMEFGTSDNYPDRAYWSDDRTFNPDLAVNEIATVTVELEVTQAGKTTLHTLVFVFKPRRIHRPFTFWIPSV